MRRRTAAVTARVTAPVEYGPMSKTDARRDGALEKHKIVNVAASTQALVSAKVSHDLSAKQDRSDVSKELVASTTQPIANECRPIENFGARLCELPDDCALLIDWYIRRCHDIDVGIIGGHSDQFRNEAGINTVIVVQKNKVLAAGFLHALREVLVQRHSNVITPKANPWVRIGQTCRYQGCFVMRAIIGNQDIEVCVVL